MNDLKFALRQLMKNPGFTAVAVLTLALGIGVNTAVFSVVNGLLLRPLPYRDSERLAIIWTHSPGANVLQDWPSPAQFSAIKSQTTAFEEIAIAQGDNVILTGQEGPERLGAIRTSSVIFSLLGVQPILGRSFSTEDDVPGKTQSVILSYGLWKQRFGGDPNVIGQAVKLDTENYNIVGVMPADFSLGNEVMPTVGATEQA